jgi:hypothetical protein
MESHFTSSLGAAVLATSPYRHWRLGDVLPPAAADEVAALPMAPPAIDDTRGRRETHNSTRRFLDADCQARFPVCREIAAMLQEGPAVAAIERLCGVSLAGSLLRIEYCLDRDGFWLEPHTDIGAKLFTMLIYLSTGADSAGWGTDIMDRDGNVIATAPSPFNSGLVFVPAGDTWHGFRKRPIRGVRRSLIVNYVKDEWRSRHELAFPDRPIPDRPIR